VINHAPFDGQVKDHFSSTSAHISFTDCEIPLVSHGQWQGLQYTEIYLLESPISVYESREWIVDIDVLSTIHDKNLQRTKCRPTLHQNPNGRKEKKRRRTRTFPYDLDPLHLVAIDNWSEALERPFNASVVRTSGNWLARLTISSFSVNRGYRTILLPESTCWQCCLTQITDYQETDIYIL
jgi:hypothetical protein